MKNTKKTVSKDNTISREDKKKSAQPTITT